MIVTLPNLLCNLEGRESKKAMSRLLYVYGDGRDGQCKLDTYTAQHNKHTITSSASTISPFCAGV